ncbi:uncharacterized protein OCT59_005867 [Rhizophagus irregularis]|uniref:uncharacterized protein n=1 Tax=Rhizophagus irregularis TaxID=588596 RepID=UPI00333033A8|nr:hypothetical protein OCT59_005867 [Rhizophagus irregularis]
MNELFKWIDEAIAKKHIKHYEYKYFKNIQEIGIGTIKELVHEHSYNVLVNQDTIKLAILDCQKELKH